MQQEEEDEEDDDLDNPNEDDDEAAQFGMDDMAAVNYNEDIEVEAYDPGENEDAGAGGGDDY